METVSRSVKDVFTISSQILKAYKKKTTRRLMVIDSFLVFCILMVVLQVAYRFLKGTHPLHALLAASFFALGEFALACAMRVQMTSSEFSHVSHKQAFLDFFKGSLILAFFSMNYVG
jgi:oligosaccharyltransferase complex subunit epsilon